MKKNNLIKTIGFSSMALFMGALTIFGFVPMAKAQPLATASETATEYTTEEPTGLITPKADDPVIYTTESGLEIKYGNALPDTNIGTMTSGNLSGFPYFKTGNYTWVIIGRSTNVPATFNSAFNAHLFSTWKNKTIYTNNKAFFSSTYEANTPAGSAINSATGSRGYVMDNYTLNLSKPVANAEIPSGCVLALANSTTGTCAFYSGNSYTTSAAHTFAGANNTLRTTCANYYTNDTFGFGNYKSSLQSITLKQHGNYTNRWTHTYATTNLHFFPMEINHMSISVQQGVNNDQTYTAGNFKMSTYLTEAQMNLGVDYWCRTMHTHEWVGFVNSSGGFEAYQWTNTVRGVRPACVISLA